MPCRTDYHPNESNNNNNFVDPRPLKNRINNLEAMLCAIFNELEDLNIIGEVMVNAEKNGMVEINDFYQEHKEEDKKRLANELVKFLSKFSEHELKLIKELIKNR